MALTRNILTIQDLSSLDFYCDGNGKLRLPKISDLVCLNDTSFPNTIPADPSTYTTLPTPLLNGYQVTVEFSTGYVRWVYDELSNTWTSCGRDFLSGGGLIGNKT